MPRSGRLLIVLLWVGVAVIGAYWGIWFFGPRAWVASLSTREYVAFENAFPISDAWLAGSYAAAAITLRARKPSAMFWLIAAGSASLYLAGMDILFDLENGVYAETGAALTEGAINLTSFGLGVWCLVSGWTKANRFRAVGA